MAEVREYVAANHYNVNPERWYAWYEASGWMLSTRTAMKDWKGAVRYWHYSRPAPPRPGEVCSRCLQNPPSVDPKSEFCVDCLDEIAAKSKAMGIEPEK